jgi:hypothetical protein
LYRHGFNIAREGRAGCTDAFTALKTRAAEVGRALASYFNLYQKTNPMKNTEKLKQLLTEHERLEGEKLRHEKLGAELLNEETQLMRTADIEDPAEFDAVNQVRLKREMVPNKVKAFGDATEKVLAELAEESARRLAEHRAAVLARTEALKDNVAKVLEPYFAPETSSPNLAALILHEHDTGLISAKRAAGRIAGQSVAGKFLFDQSDTLRNGNFLSLPAAVHAKRLLGMIEEFEAVKI